MRYEYICTNTLCPVCEEEKILEITCKILDRDSQVCPECGEKLKKIPSVPYKNGVMHPKHTGVKDHV